MMGYDPSGEAYSSYDAVHYTWTGYPSGDWTFDKINDDTGTSFSIDYFIGSTAEEFKQFVINQARIISGWSWTIGLSVEYTGSDLIADYMVGTNLTLPWNDTDGYSHRLDGRLVMLRALIVDDMSKGQRLAVEMLAMILYPNSASSYGYADGGGFGVPTAQEGGDNMQQFYWKSTFEDEGII